MNRFLLDYDAALEPQALKKLAGALGPYDVVQLGRDNFSLPPHQLSKDEPVRCILVTRLNGGWHQYHVETVQKNPAVSHWVIAVVRDVKKMEQETIRNRFGAIFSETDSYSELCFSDANHFSELKDLLQKPIKTGRNLLIASRQEALAEECAQLLRSCLPAWKIQAAVDPCPEDYDYQDALLLVGEKPEDLALPAPNKRFRHFFIWLHQPLFADHQEKKELLESVKHEMNEKGWDIADYSAHTSISSLLNEKAKHLIETDEMLPAGLITDHDFVMWDHYGLPVIQAKWTPEAVTAFLKNNCVFPQIIRQLEQKKPAKER